MVESTCFRNKAQVNSQPIRKKYIPPIYRYIARTAQKKYLCPLCCCCLPLRAPSLCPLGQRKKSLMNAASVLQAKFLVPDWGYSRQLHMVVVPVRQATYIGWRAGTTTLCHSVIFGVHIKREGEEGGTGLCLWQPSYLPWHAVPGVFNKFRR